MTIPQDVLEIIEEYGAKPLGLDEKLCFECQQSCWGTCCQNINILLTPFDVYRMARHKGMTMLEFMDRYCDAYPGHDSRWPIALLRGAAMGRCDFLDEQGRCTIRDARPSVCRASPVGRVTHVRRPGEKADQVEDIEVPILKLPHPHCQKKNSHPVTNNVTVREWMEQNKVREWWDGTDAWFGLMSWAMEQTQFHKWASDRTFALMFPFMFAMDEMVPPGTPEEEMNRRAVEAVRELITGIAAGYGHGPRASAGVQEGVRSASRAKQIMETGIYDDAVTDADTDGWVPTCILIIDTETNTRVRTFDTPSDENFREVTRFLIQEALRGVDVGKYVVAVNENDRQAIRGDDLLAKTLAGIMERA